MYAPSLSPVRPIHPITNTSTSQTNPQPQQTVESLEELQRLTAATGDRPLVLRYHASWCSVRFGGFGVVVDVYVYPFDIQRTPNDTDPALTHPTLNINHTKQACKKFAPSWLQAAGAYSGPDGFDFMDVDVTVRF
jgi:hypothetical protein